jgi:hypothetical protein
MSGTFAAGLTVLDIKKALRYQQGFFTSTFDIPS